MPLPGYGNKWQNFADVITKAIVSCETTGNIVTDHFTDASKMVGIGRRATENLWTLHLYGPGDVIELPNLGMKFAIEELYADVDFGGDGNDEPEGMA